MAAIHHVIHFDAYQDMNQYNSYQSPQKLAIVSESGYFLAKD
jgi:hypothetical protein